MVFNGMRNNNNTSQACKRRVEHLPSDPDAQRMAQRHALRFMKVTWEDNARTKGSCWGPCISDMTLLADGMRLPVLRQPNFTDLTWDVAMEKIPLVVGNENGGSLYPVSLTDYLHNFGSYAGNEGNSSLLAPERDSHVVVSSQACFLPLEEGKHTSFNVSILNYQTRRNSPSVLVIVATSKGTSAQILTGGQQDIFFNNMGQRTRFLGQRLKDNRRERGVALEGAMTQEEKQDNVVVVIQVPLRQAQRRSFGWGGLGFGGSGGNAQAFDDCCEAEAEMLCSAPAAPQQACYAPSYKNKNRGGERRSRAANCDVEPAIVKTGQNEGAFPSVSGLGLQRDSRFPVRVTLQFYKSTSNGVMSQPTIDSIAAQLAQSRSQADYIGSLVAGGYSWRPTEPRQVSTHHHHPIVSPPPPPPPPAVELKHPGVTCDNCSAAIVSSARFKCLQCPDYDLCATCEVAMDTSGVVLHNPTHVFAKIRDSRAQLHNLDLTNRSHLKHHGVRCSRCSVQPIVGVRYACVCCRGFNHCEGCEAQASHQLSSGHNVVKVVNSATLQAAARYPPSPAPQQVVWNMPGLFS